MSDLILHHYEMSPFSEKTRRILAFKGLPWKAVRAPAVMPKPDVIALTGGYRKTPILQIGNHVYCDTSLIAQVLDQRVPVPPLYPSPLAEAVAEWADGALFEVAVPLALRPTRFDDTLALLTPDELSKMGEDRAAMREGARRKGLPVVTARDHLAVYLERLDRALATSSFLLGSAPTIADFSAYHSVWFLEKVAPEPLRPWANLRGWMVRIASIPSARVTPITSDAALRISRDSPTDYRPDAPFEDASGLLADQRVVVRAADYGRDPVEGNLVLATPNEVAIRREDPRAGTVFVHFPRVGYEITPPRN